MVLLELGRTKEEVGDNVQELGWSRPHTALQLMESTMDLVQRQ